MRELTEAEQIAAYEAFNFLYDTSRLDDRLVIVEYAFAAGLDYQQAKIASQEAALGSCREAFEHLEADNARLRAALAKAKDQ